MANWTYSCSYYELNSDGTETNKNDTWSWWDPSVYRVYFTLSHDSTDQYLRTLSAPIVACHTGGHNVTTYGHGYEGSGGTLALFLGESYTDADGNTLSKGTQISEAVTVDAISSQNYVHYSNGTLALCDGDYSNEESWFIPRHTPSGNQEIANVPNAKQDTVIEVTRKFEINRDIIVPEDGSIKVYIGPTTTDTVSGYRVFQVAFDTATSINIEVLVKFYANYPSKMNDIYSCKTSDYLGECYLTIGATFSSAKNEASISSPSETAYIFKGWYPENSSHAYFSDNPTVTADSTTISTPTNYYGCWSPIKKTVIFYRNYDSSDTTVSYTTSDQIMRYCGGTYGTLGDAKKSAGVQDLTRSGYDFQYWGSSRSATSAASDTLQLWENNLYYYAIWKKLYSVWIRQKKIDEDGKYIQNEDNTYQLEWVKKLNIRIYNKSTGEWKEECPKIWNATDKKWEDTWE